MPTVITIRGKHESIDYAKVTWFDDTVSAQKYCDSVNTGPKKYWIKAEIVQDGEEIVLKMPDGDY